MYEGSDEMPYLLISKHGLPILAAAYETEAEALALARNADLPEEACSSFSGLTAWISQQWPPSGIYETEKEFEFARLIMRREDGAFLLKCTLIITGVTRAELTAALGFSDRRRDGSAVRKVLHAKYALGGSGRRALAYFLKYGAMSIEEEREIFETLTQKFPKLRRRKHRRSYDELPAGGPPWLL
jgi:hypothetical protein